MRLRARSIAICRPPAKRQPGDPIAIIAPHAGLMYSGPIAAHAYNLLRGRDIEVVVLVGPSHYVGFEGVAVYERGAFDTPFGPVAIAEQCAAAVANGARARSTRIRRRMYASIRSRCSCRFSSASCPTPRSCRSSWDISGAKPPTRWAMRSPPRVKGRRAVLVASTDLSHYQNAPKAAKLDRKVIQQVQRFDPDGLMSLLETFPEHACGGGPTVAVMRAAKLLGATDARVLKYGDSGDVSGDKNAVVGYLAAAFGTFPAADH